MKSIVQDKVFLWCVGVKLPYLGQTNDWTVQKLTKSLALCAELLGISKGAKRVAHAIFLSSDATSATQLNYGRHSQLTY